MMIAYPVETTKRNTGELAQGLQDDAYTLAFYLLGNERLAEAATEASFASVPVSHSRQFDRLRKEVIRAVLSRCRQQGITVTGRQFSGDIIGMLQNIGIEERTVVVLVDVLGLSYEEAAGLLDKPKKNIMRLLAQARLHLAA